MEQAEVAVSFLCCSRGALILFEQKYQFSLRRNTIVLWLRFTCHIFPHTREESSGTTKFTANASSTTYISGMRTYFYTSFNRNCFQEDTHIGEHNTWWVLSSITRNIYLTQCRRFFDDIELLRQRWQSSNTDSVADL